MTRAGKGQTIIEPTIDIWTRSEKKTNFLANDPKGELYLKFYYPATMRGFEVLSFNLLNPSKSNIYNPLGYAVDAARKGNAQQAVEYVANIGDVFFPTEGADDPMWPNAANNAFKRSALGLIDYYREEEAEMRLTAQHDSWSQSKLDQELDILWGHVTLYNVYQMMTQLASVKSKPDDGIKLDGADEGDDEKDYLSLFFDATEQLPTNSLRSATLDAHHSLTAMAGSEKTIASVYGISLTAMSFFTDDSIAKLTSGRPSQNFDMQGLAFPRRIDLQFNRDYMKHFALRGKFYKWSIFRHKTDDDLVDEYIENPKLDPEKDRAKIEEDGYHHSGVVDSDGWIMEVYKGLLDGQRNYFKLEIFDDETQQLMHIFYFEFTKGYQRTLDGNAFVHDPVSDDRIIKDGVLVELVKKNKHLIYGQTAMSKQHYVLGGKRTGKSETLHQPAIDQIDVHYTERPKAIFVNTPPNKASYAQIILIMINQLFNIQVDKAYRTRANQKPFYGLKEMLDEVGNLKSGGHGIEGLTTKESIGLGQEQQFTLVLQTLAQLTDLYGESADKVIQGNTTNLVYLKTTDDSMLDTLEKMSGVRHEGEIDSRSITRDAKAMINSVDGKVTESMSIKEKPVISKNDMLTMQKNNAIVFGPNNPIWSHNQTVLPMAWRLHKGLLHDLHRDYTINTVPTTSNTDDFDRLANQPNFMAMVGKRVRQANLVEEITDRYKQYYGKDGKPLTDYQMRLINVEDLSVQLMQGINEEIHAQSREQMEEEAEEQELQDEISDEDLAAFEDENNADEMIQHSDDNSEFIENKHQAEKNQKRYTGLIYANHTMSRDMLASVTPKGDKGDKLGVQEVRHSLDTVVATAYDMSRPSFKKDPQFVVNKAGSLVNAKTGELYISAYGDQEHSKYTETLDAFQGEGTNTNDTGEIGSDQKYQVEDAFLKFLVQRGSWKNIANGEFDKEMATAYSKYMSTGGVDTDDIRG